MGNWVDSGKGLELRSDSKVLGEKRVGVVKFDDEDECGSRKRIKMRDLEYMCRAEGSGKKRFGGQTQLNDEEMSEITEVPVTSEMNASRAGRGVRSTFLVAVDPLPKALDLNKDVCFVKNKVQNGCQQLFKSLGEATSRRDQVTGVPSASGLDCSQVGTSVKTTTPVVVNPIPKPLDCNTDMSNGGSTIQNGTQKCAQSTEKTRLPRENVTHVPKISTWDTFQTANSMSGGIPAVVSPVPRALDLNSDSCIISNTVQNCSQQSSQNLEKYTVLRGHDKECHTNPGSAKGNVLDLNAKCVSSSNRDPFYPYKDLNDLKSGDVSECGSCTGPLEEKDPMTVWKEMKENGFLSSTHGGITKPKQPVVIPMPTPKVKQQPGVLPMLNPLGGVPTSKQHGGIPIPKPRARKNKTEEQKKKVERAKKEQVDRFAKLAAPSGLLNELNPGIINHVRNRKQVHSIIQALVRSERVEFSHEGTGQTIYQQDKHVENSQDRHKMSESWASWRPNSLFDDMRAQGYTILMNKPSLVEEDNIIEGYPTSKDSFGGNCFASHYTRRSEGDSLELKLSSSTIAPDEDNPSSCKEEMTSYLSFKAASVASQWLELIQQDIQGRLAALQRSRKRVQNVISTDLPLLLKKEFPFDKEIDFSTKKSSVNAFTSHALAEMHRARWGPRFDQMDKALLEEKEQLESWLNQVREMQVHCNKGLQLINWGACGTSENDTRSDKLDSSQREVAIRAAAASIYATCNFILSSNAPPVC